jgi:hypothetical protein
MDALAAAAYILVVPAPEAFNRSGAPRTTLRGFALLREEPRELWVDVLCSSGGGCGGALMAHAERLAAQLGKARVRLTAVREAVPFYRHLRYAGEVYPAAEEPVLMWKSLRLPQRQGGGCAQ